VSYKHGAVSQGGYVFIGGDGVRLFVSRNTQKLRPTQQIFTKFGENAGLYGYTAVSLILDRGGDCWALAEVYTLLSAMLFGIVGGVA